VPLAGRVGLVIVGIGKPVGLLVGFFVGSWRGGFVLIATGVKVEVGRTSTVDDGIGVSVTVEAGVVVNVGVVVAGVGEAVSEMDGVWVAACSVGVEVEDANRPMILLPKIKPKAKMPIQPRINKIKKIGPYRRKMERGFLAGAGAGEGACACAGGGGA
jgi:hypothetical protein